MGKGSSKQRDVIEYETTSDEGFTKTLKKDLQVLIAYASGKHLCVLILSIFSLYEYVYEIQLDSVLASCSLKPIC